MCLGQQSIQTMILHAKDRSFLKGKKTNKNKLHITITFYINNPVLSEQSPLFFVNVS